MSAAFGRTDTEFAAWLDADRPRCLLVEVSAWNDELPGLVPRYLANVPFATRPIDTPANTIYEDLVVETPDFVASLSEVFTGRSQSSWGEISLINADGELDAWLDDGWDGRPVRLLLGAPTWPRHDFRDVLAGVVADIDAPARDRIALRLRDKTHLLDRPIQTNLVGGSTVNAERPRPLCYGQCINVEPVLLDAATHLYQVHDGAIEAITAVRDNGLSVTYTANLAAGTFTLNAAPAGRITADVKGAKVSGTWLQSAAQIVEHIVTVRAPLTAADLDAASIAAFGATCPQLLGLYVGDRRNTIDAIDELLASVGGWWVFDRAGRLRLGRFAGPAGTPVLELTADDVVAASAGVDRRELPRASVRLGYARNWTRQDADGLAGAVAEADRALYAAASRVTTATNAVGTKHVLATSPDVVETLIVGAADAAAEAARRAALAAQVRTVVRLKTSARPLRINLGDVVRLTHPRFGYAAGELAVVVGLREHLLAGQVELELWR